LQAFCGQLEGAADARDLDAVRAGLPQLRALLVATADAGEIGD